jgi:hypothetical protein
MSITQARRVLAMARGPQAAQTRFEYVAGSLTNHFRYSQCFITLRTVPPPVQSCTRVEEPTL